MQAHDPATDGLDFVVQVRFEELVIVAPPALLVRNASHPHAAWVAALQCFLVADDVKFYFSELEALWLTRMHGLREMMKENRAYLKTLLESNGKRTVLDIDVEAPVLVVPEDPASPSTPYLMVDLGRVRVATEKLHQPQAQRANPKLLLSSSSSSSSSRGEEEEVDGGFVHVTEGKGSHDGSSSSTTITQSATRETAKLDEPLSPLLSAHHFAANNNNNSSSSSQASDGGEGSRVVTRAPWRQPKPR